MRQQHRRRAHLRAAGGRDGRVDTEDAVGDDVLGGHHRLLEGADEAVAAVLVQHTLADVSMATKLSNLQRDLIGGTRPSTYLACKAFSDNQHRHTQAYSWPRLVPGPDARRRLAVCSCLASITWTTKPLNCRPPEFGTAAVGNSAEVETLSKEKRLPPEPTVQTNGDRGGGLGGGGGGGGGGDGDGGGGLLRDTTSRYEVGDHVHHLTGAFANRPSLLMTLLYSIWTDGDGRLKRSHEPAAAPCMTFMTSNSHRGLTAESSCTPCRSCKTRQRKEGEKLTAWAVAG